MAYSLTIRPSAYKQLQRIPEIEQKRIRRKLDVLVADPFADGLDIKKLQGEVGYRLRVGSYRVLYLLEETVQIVEIIRVAHRKEVYK